MLVHYLLCTYLANPVTYVYAYSFDITFTKFATMHDNISRFFKGSKDLLCPF